MLKKPRKERHSTGTSIHYQSGTIVKYWKKRYNKRHWMTVYPSKGKVRDYPRKQNRRRKRN